MTRKEDEGKVTRDSEHQFRQIVDSLLRNQRPATVQVQALSGRNGRPLCFNYKTGQCLTDKTLRILASSTLHISQKESMPGNTRLVVNLSKDDRSPSKLESDRETTDCKERSQFQLLQAPKWRGYREEGSLVGPRHQDRLFFMKRIPIVMS